MDMWRRLVINFLREEDGQSVLQYAILMAWVTLASVAMINGVAGAEKGVWRTTNTQLTAANTAAS
jgi:Flp pilus assembly pilin Flp